MIPPLAINVYCNDNIKKKYAKQQHDVYDNAKHGFDNRGKRRVREEIGIMQIFGCLWMQREK